MSGIDCDEVLREVEAYLDHELPNDRTEFIAVHLRTCSPCARRADFQQRLRAIIARKCAVEQAVPDSLIVKIRMVIDEEHGPATQA
ncbi:MAG TPA: mycothiol system anti-sigma-R factor [Actinomycetota bacterium]|nr:mycothiol system anti-sigma-R factor [Actinomycetota bacterium]